LIEDKRQFLKSKGKDEDTINKEIEKIKKNGRLKTALKL
jgi:hypothetical protein